MTKSVLDAKICSVRDSLFHFNPNSIAIGWVIQFVKRNFLCQKFSSRKASQFLDTSVEIYHGKILVIISKVNDSRDVFSKGPELLLTLDQLRFKFFLCCNVLDPYGNSFCRFTIFIDHGIFRAEPTA